MGGGQRSAAERNLLRLLHDHSARHQLLEIHAHSLRRHLLHSPTLLSHLISVAAVLRRSSYALRLFSHSSAADADLSVFNAAIKASSMSSSTSSISFSLFSSLHRHGLRPDRLTFAPLIKSAANLSDLRLGASAHSAAFLSGFHTHSAVAIAVLELYAVCGRMSDASKMFDEMQYRDVIIYNLMINGICRHGDIESGLHLFQSMRVRNLVTWNSMIAGLSRKGRNYEAIQLFKEMLGTEFEPDDATLATILPICARLGEIETGKWIHNYARRKGLLKNAVNACNSLVDMYCKFGDLEAAWIVFDGIPKKNVVSWNAMINGLAFNGRGEAGVRMFDEMQSRGINPNSGTFVGVLSCCRHVGMLDRGKELFRVMKNTYGIEMNIEHYGCMVDLLGRCGRLNEACELIMSMSIVRPNAAIWGALLSACRNSGDLVVAEIAAKELIGLEPSNSGNYVLLSNMYAEAGRWDEVDRLRLLMKENCVQKEQGQSAVGKTFI